MINYIAHSMESIVGDAEWDQAVEEYCAALAVAKENNYRGWEHANCDHAYDYCQVTTA